MSLFPVVPYVDNPELSWEERFKRLRIYATRLEEEVKELAAANAKLRSDASWAQEAEIERARREESW